MKKTLLIILTIVSSACGLFSLILGLIDLSDPTTIGLNILFILLGLFFFAVPIYAWARYRRNNPRRKAKANNIIRPTNYVSSNQYFTATQNTIHERSTMSTHGAGNNSLAPKNKTPHPVDALLPSAMEFVLQQREASVSALTDHLQIRYAQAARIIDQMEQLGLVGAYKGSAPRTVLVTKQQWTNIKQNLHIEENAQAGSPVPEELEEIKKIESRFQTLYAYAQHRMLNAHEGKLLLKQIKDSFCAEEHPLPVQLRFEQLCEEYAPKFETPNPWLSIDSMKGQEFEIWCSDILHEIGFQNIEMTPGSGDQGVDILAQKSGIKYAIQCKRYSTDLGNTPIQEVNAGKMFYHCHVGVVMTNRHFTKGAKEMAEATGTLLWDRDTLQSMIDSISHDTESWTHPTPIS